MLREKKSQPMEEVLENKINIIHLIITFPNTIISIHLQKDVL
jgi:hypothetical protein